MAGNPVGGTDQIQNYRNRVVAAVSIGNGRDRRDLLLVNEQLKAGGAKNARDIRIPGHADAN